MFLGTKPYPKEDSFENFLAANGGSSNAYTDSENTVYYFGMEAEASNRLEEGLNRFGSFFTSPLFTESATSRELNAIESENAKNLQSDTFRTYQIEKARCNPKHPYSKFFTGNKKTLVQDAKQKKIDIRNELINFNQKYYSSNQMTLAVVAPQPLAQLKQMVKEGFGRIPNRNSALPESEWAGVPPFSSDSVIPSFQTVVEAVPVQELRQVTLAWPIVYDSPEQKRVTLLNKQGNYVSHLLGHDGPGSLLSYLKKKNWVNSFAAASDEQLSDFETFQVTVELTTHGLEHVDDVIESVYSYIQMLKTEPIPDYIWDEELLLTELDWRFLTKGAASNYATSLSNGMQKYPPNLLLAGPRRLAVSEYSGVTSAPRSGFSSAEEKAYTKKLTMDVIDRLTVENCVLTVLSKSFAGQTNQKEKWYGTDYRVRPVPVNTMNQWRNPASPAKIGIAYPKPNVFIPSEAGLRVKTPPPSFNLDGPAKLSFEERMKPVTPPRIIRDDGPEGRWTVHFKQDDRFGQPKAFVIFQLLTKQVYSSAKCAILASLYQQCATDRLDEYAYDASLAGLTFDIQVLPRGVRLTYGGYNDKLQEFAAYVTKKLSKESKSMLPRTDAEFERYKDNLTRGLAAFDFKQPYAHASYYAYLAMQPLGFQYTNADLREAVETASLADLQAYVQTLWSSGKGEALVQGNLDEKEAITLVNTVDKTLGFKTISKDELPGRPKALSLPVSNETPSQINVAEPNPSNGNSAVHVVLQSLGRTEKDHMLIEILSSIVNEPFYGE